MTIVTGKTLDYDKHLKYEFGTYVQAHTKNEPTNQMTERAIDRIYLRPNTNRQGSHIVMNLTTGQAITRSNIDVVPLPGTVKEQVEEMALSQGIQLVKFTN